MKFNGFHHIGLAVKDVEKSRAFYKALGGVDTLSFPVGDFTYYLIDMGGNAVVELIPKLNDGSPEQVEPRWMHICLNTDDCKAAYAHALEVGAKELIPPKEVALGADMKVCCAFVSGPDGEEIEFITVL